MTLEKIIIFIMCFVGFSNSFIIGKLIKDMERFANETIVLANGVRNLQNETIKLAIRMEQKKR